MLIKPFWVRFACALHLSFDCWPQFIKIYMQEMGFVFWSEVWTTREKGTNPFQCTQLTISVVVPLSPAQRSQNYDGHLTCYPRMDFFLARSSVIEYIVVTHSSTI